MAGVPPCGWHGSAYDFHPSISRQTREILAQDERLFNAFNRRDLEVMKSMLSQDLEFHHDKVGLIDDEQTLESTVNLFNGDSDLRRELLPDATKAHPIPGCGAIQTGRHHFYHTTEDGQADCGVFKFLHSWKRTDDEWQITRAVSYDR